LIRKLTMTECKILFTTPRIGRADNTAMVQTFARGSEKLPDLQRIILLSGKLDALQDYRTAIRIGKGLSSRGVEKIQASISPFDPCNLQLTSGSTGHPKVSTLHHYGLLNNARFIGDRMALTPRDILCCPPPLFHCFGLVLGLLATITHGSKIVYPAEIFDGPATLRAITEEKCTAVHGVPAMFDTLFSLPRPADFDCSALRTGIIAGAPVPRHLMELLVNDFGMHEFTSSYGLTEASPTCFNAFVTDSIARRLTTVGTLMPHASAKVIDRQGRIVPVGVRGELCIAGYQLMAGYWDNPDRTIECMIADDNGTLWLHTGDEAVIDNEGYCSITGRFKDIIIRGGENIYPLEIEERLVAHDAVDRAIVVGVPDSRYGEQVVAFMMRRQGADRPSLHTLQTWIRQTLGRHKVPVYIFWLGEDGVPEEIPITGSGKVKKFALRDLASKILEQRSAKL
jgi:acyl-CoA synthetase (AMP-forming)/AMP-acid ligase II